MKKLKKTMLSFLLTLMLVSGITPVSNLTSIPATTVQAAVSKKQTAKFVRGVDGDTAKLSVKGKTYTFRFLAIDTPETVKPNTPPAFMGKKHRITQNLHWQKQKKLKSSMMVTERINMVVN
jgi:endonuclease YncB( thermonuclease family)